MIRKSLIISVMTLALCGTVPAFAQYDGDTSARLRRMEKELETLNRAVYKGETPPPGALTPMESSGPGAAAMELRLQQLEAAMRDLTGKMEEQTYANRQIQERLDRVLSELDRRMVEVETRVRMGNTTQMGVGATTAYPNPGYSDQGDPSVPSWVGGTAGMDGSGALTGMDNNMGAGDLPPQPAMAGPTGLNSGIPGNNLGVLNDDPMVSGQSQTTLPLASDSPAAHYEQAFALLRDKNYEVAGTAFEDFLKRWPNHELSANAKYWLGESWYVRNNFERAARVFAESYQQAPKGPKGPDNLLKLALSLNGMGKKDEACLTLGQLKKEYGASTSPIVARAGQEATRIGCP